MTDRELRIGRCTLIAATLWCTSLGLLLYMTIEEPQVLTATWSVFCAAAAATISVRCFLITQTRDLRNSQDVLREAQHNGVLKHLGQPSS